jgi:hypothetical protein
MKEKYLNLIDNTLEFLQYSDQEEVMSTPSTVSMPKPKPLPMPKYTQKLEPRQSQCTSDVATPPPPVKPPEKKETRFALDPPTPPPTSSKENFCKLMQKIDPHLTLHDTIPDDQRAKRVNKSWQLKGSIPDIPILFKGEVEHRILLQNIAKAIEIHFAPSRIIDIEKVEKWDAFLQPPHLKLIIVPDSVLWSAKALLPFYKEKPQERKHFLGNTPLLLLPDLSLYFKDPSLKRSLWNVICQMLKKT